MLRTSEWRKRSESVVWSEERRRNSLKRRTAACAVLALVLAAASMLTLQSSLAQTNPNHDITRLPAYEGQSDRIHVYSYWFPQSWTKENPENPIIHSFTDSTGADLSLKTCAEMWSDVATYANADICLKSTTPEVETSADDTEGGVVEPYKAFNWPFTVFHDAIAEPNEVATLKLRESSAPEATPGDLVIFEITLISTYPHVAVRAAHDTIVEGETADFVLHLPRMLRPLTVRYYVGYGGPYRGHMRQEQTGYGKMVTVPANTTTHTFSLPTYMSVAVGESYTFVMLYTFSEMAYTAGSRIAWVNIADGPDSIADEVSLRAFPSGRITSEKSIWAIFEIKSAVRAVERRDFVVTITESSGASDFVDSANEGQRTVSIHPYYDRVIVLVPLQDDQTDEPDGAITVTLNGTSKSASVIVYDDD